MFLHYRNSGFVTTGREMTWGHGRKNRRKEFHDKYGISEVNWKCGEVSRDFSSLPPRRATHGCIRAQHRCRKPEIITRRFKTWQRLPRQPTAKRSWIPARAPIVPSAAKPPAL